MFLSNPKCFFYSTLVSEEVVLDNIPALFRCKIGLEKAAQSCRCRIVLAFDIPKDKVSIIVVEIPVSAVNGVILIGVLLDNVGYTGERLILLRLNEPVGVLQNKISASELTAEVHFSS